MKYINSLLIIAILFGCSKLSENEYYSLAKENYAEQNFELAINNFRSLIDNYPESIHSSEALFMLGFINANDVKDYDEAKKYYQKFIEKYPDHELIGSATYELDNLGKDINELSIFKNLEADTTEEISAK